MTNNGILLTEKYRPTKLEDLVGHARYIPEIRGWATAWKQHKPTFKSLFLYGPSGTGKTSVVSCLATECEWKIVEVNGGDVKVKEIDDNRLRSVAGDAMIWGHDVLILVDEIDSLSKKQLGELETYVEQTHNPVVLTCNDEYGVSRLTQYFRENSLKIKFGKLNNGTVKRLVEDIINRECITVKDLDYRVEGADGDVRYLLNNLLTPEYIPRKIEINVFNIVHDIFRGQWNGDDKGVDIELIWYTVKSNIYNFYDDIYGEPVVDYLMKTDMLISRQYQKIGREGRRAFRYRQYVISLMKMLPMHQKTAQIVIPKYYTSEYARKGQSPEILTIARNLHMSYKKALQFVHEYPDLRQSALVRDDENPLRPLWATTKGQKKKAEVKEQVKTLPATAKKPISVFDFA